jgi:restriction system protein
LAIRRAIDLRDLGDLTALDPTGFERLVEYVLSSRGFAEVEHCGGSGDRGADLIAIDENGRRVVVQCKRYGLSNKVGSPEIQRFVGAITIHHANRGIVVTTSTYTPEAIAIARASRVELIDGATLLGWIRETNS